MTINVEAFNDLLALLNRVRAEPLQSDVHSFERHGDNGAEQVRRVEFNMWAVVGVSADASCGAAACAIGHMALDPVLSKKYGIERATSGGWVDAAGKHWINWDYGAMAIFGIDIADAHNLFAPLAYRGEEEDEDDIPIGEVIERIEGFLEERGIER